jgi:hypothetical protein
MFIGPMLCDDPRFSFIICTRVRRIIRRLHLCRRHCTAKSVRRPAPAITYIPMVVLNDVVALNATVIQL